MTDQQSNDHFFKFFEWRIDFIRRTCLEEVDGRINELLEGKILACTYLDSLAGYRHGGKSSAQRFRRFLIEDSGQGDTWRKVSLILLRQYIERKDAKLFANLVSLLNRLGAVKTSFSNLNYNPDIPLETLLRECDEALPAREAVAFRDDLRRFEYSSILWHAYRNASVHETALGLNRAMNIADHPFPFYANEIMFCSGEQIENVRFGIPLRYLLTTINGGLKTLKDLVSNGDVELTLKGAYDEPQMAASGKKKSTVEDIGYPRLVTKPFRSFLKDTGSLLGECKKNHDLFASTDNEEYRWLEGAFARSAITSSVFALESLISCILSNFKAREAHQLPDRLVRDAGLIHKSFEFLPLIERVFLTPCLCCQDQNKILSNFFDRGTTEFQALGELIEIRDALAHSRPIRRRMEITSKGKNAHEFDDKFKENFWPFTLIPKDIFIIGLADAERSKDIVDWTIERLNIFLDGIIVRNHWMTTEQIELGPK